MKTVRILTHSYAILLRLYPPRLREGFGEEMQVVFEHVVSEAVKRGWATMAGLCLRELYDLPLVVLRDRLRRFRKYRAKESGEMSYVTHKPEKLESEHTPGSVQTVNGAASWGETLVGVFPFVLVGLAFLYARLDDFISAGARYGRSYFALENGYYVLLAAFAILFVGLGIGWAKGFSRWTFSYAGMALLFPFVFSGLAINALPAIGDPSGPRQNLGGWGWLPLLIVVVAVLISRRSLRPLMWPFVQTWRDWTNLSFLFYSGLMAFFASFALDGSNLSDDITGLIIETAIFSVGALAYLRSRSIRQRVVSLAGGLVALFLSSLIVPVILGSEDIESLAGSLWRFNILAIFWLVLVFLPSLLGLLRRGVEARRAV